MGFHVGNKVARLCKPLTTIDYLAFIRSNS